MCRGGRGWFGDPEKPEQGQSHLTRSRRRVELVSVEVTRSPEGRAQRSHRTFSFLVVRLFIYFFLNHFLKNH